MRALIAWSIFTLFFGIAGAQSSTHWQIVKSALPAINDIFFLNTDTGFIVGEQATVMRTTDGGAYWQPLVVQGVSQSTTFKSIAFASALNGSIDGMLHTTNGGDSWNLSSAPPGDTGFSANRVTFADDSIGYRAGGDIYSIARLARTTDAGRSWNQVNTPNQGSRSLGMFRWADFRDAGHGMVISTDNSTPHNYSLWYTSNSCASWEISESATEMYCATHVGFNWVMGVSGELLLLDDDAANWKTTLLMAPLGLRQERFGFADTGVGYATSRELKGKLLKTTNGGSSWNLLNVSADNSDTLIFSALAAPATNVAHVVAMANANTSPTYMILKTTDGGGPVSGVAGFSSESSDVVEIFPNPISSSFASLHFPSSSKLRILQVRDILGRVVCTLPIDAETREHTIDTREFLPGVYWCKLATSTAMFAVMK